MTNTIPLKAFDAYPQGVRDWIEQDLKWKYEDISSLSIYNEIVENPDAKDWKSMWRYGNYTDVTIGGVLEVKCQRFIRLENGDWEKEEKAE